jgi:GNAT superfamily N-acetyltransferase
MITRNDTHIVVGSIVRRVIKGLHIHKATWPIAGIVDFFCIHPAWRKKGLGHQLLASIQNSHTAVPPPHLILWEGLRLDIPPLAIGALWMMQCTGSSNRSSALILKGKEAIDAWAILRTKSDTWSEYIESSEISIWSVKNGFIAIWNTFHRSIPDGAPIEVIIAYSSKEAVYDYTRSFQGILLSDTQFDDWKFDSPFQWIAYNLTSGYIQTNYPCISF